MQYKFKNSFFLDNISLPVINNDFFNLCENDLTEVELLITLKRMQNNKTPCNSNKTYEFGVTCSIKKKFGSVGR